jgi:hypothetical protein
LVGVFTGRHSNFVPFCFSDQYSYDLTFCGAVCFSFREPVVVSLRQPVRFSFDQSFCVALGLA